MGTGSLAATATYR